MGLFDLLRPAQKTTTATPRDTLAVEITADELALIEWLAYAGYNQANHHGLAERPADGPVPAFVKALRMRVGAAMAADDNPAGIPLFEHEIESIERAVRALDASYYTRQHQEVQAGVDLIRQLHVRLGYAQAVRYLGDVPVFRDALP